MAIFYSTGNPAFQCLTRWTTMVAAHLWAQGEAREGSAMSNRVLPRFTGLGFGVMISGVMMMTMSALADGLKDEIAPTGKLRVAIGISPAGGAFWSNKTESGAYAGVSVDLG